VADLTSNLYLAISVKNLMGPGLLSAGASLGGFHVRATEALAGVGVATVEAAAKFQAMTQQVANNTTMTTADLAAMRQGILKMSTDSGAPLDQLGNGFMHIENMGYNASDSMKILRAAMESAVSTGGDTGQVANVLANAMHEYGMKAGDASKAMDVLHMASAKGNMTLEQFVESGGKAIGMAANMGVPLVQVSAAMAALTQHGQNAAAASTLVTGMLSKIVNPAKSAETELGILSKRTGIDLVGDFTAAGLKSRGFTGVLADLKAATGGNASEMFKLIPALRGGLGAMILTGTGARDYGKVLGSLNAVMAGKLHPTTTAYEASQKTLAVQMARMRAAINAVAIEIGNGFLPVLTPLVHIMADHPHVVIAVVGAYATLRIAMATGRSATMLWTGATTGASLATRLLGDAIEFARAGMLTYYVQETISTVATKARTAVMALANLATLAFTTATGAATAALTFFTSGAWLGVAAQTAMKVAGLATSAMTGAWTAAQWLLNAALTANPIGLVIVAIGLLAGALIWGYKNVDKVRDALTWLYKAFRSLMDSAFPGFGKTLDLFVNGPLKAVADTVNGLIDGLGKLFGLIKSGQGITVNMGAAQQLRLNKKDEGSFAHGLDKKFGGTGVGSAYWDYAMLMKGVTGYWTTFVKQHRDVATQYLALLKAEGNKAGARTIQSLLDAGHKTSAATSNPLDQALYSHDPRAARRWQIAANGGKDPAIRAATDRFSSDRATTQRDLALYRHGANDLAKLRVDLVRLGAEATTTQERNAVLSLQTQIQLAEAARRTAATRHAQTVAHQARVEAHQARVEAYHRQVLAMRSQRSAFGGQAGTVRDDMALYRAGMMTARQVAADMARLGSMAQTPAERAQLATLQTQLRVAEHTQQQAATHHAAVAAHHVQVTAHHARTTERTSELRNLSGLLTIAERAARSDRKNNPGAMGGDVARIVSLDRQYELLRTGNKDLANKLADSLGQTFEAHTAAGVVTGMLKLPRGLGRGSYGVSPRVTPGQADQFGSEAASFNGTSGSAMADLLRTQDRLIASLELGIAQRDRQIANDEALLRVNTETRDATRTVASKIGVPPVKTPDGLARLTGRR
jgi:TP901 family phage tail tape measure protein